MKPDVVEKERLAVKAGHRHLDDARVTASRSARAG
jgi:hypothetical protein